MQLTDCNTLIDNTSKGCRPAVQVIAYSIPYDQTLGALNGIQLPLICMYVGEALACLVS